MKVRVISAVVAAAIVALPVYFGGIYYAFLVGVVALLGLKEIFDLKKSHKRLPFWVCVIAILSLLLLTYTNLNGGSTIYGVTYQRLIFTVLALLVPALIYKKDKYTTGDAFYLIGTVIFLGLASNSFLVVRDKGFNFFVYMILIPIITDTFAYIIGSLIGKHKMCPTISPNKSWEGFFAGLAIGTLIPCIVYCIFVGDFSWKLILLTALLSTAGQVGDVIFSKIKRENDIKDFSNIMPGHGGVLDRLDSTSIIFMTFILLSSVLY